MNEQNLIIIEGPQGVGKTGLANYLREKIKSSNLYRLSGIPDKTQTGLLKNEEMYHGLLDYMKTLENSGMNLIFDRNFFSEYVYSKLGYKDYDFSSVYNDLVEKYLNLKFNRIFIALYLENSDVYIERLKREKAEYVKFNLENSLNQQIEYLKLSDELEKTGKVKVLKVAMDDFDKGYEIINKELNIK
jgi:hypothetical protein